MTVSDLTDEQLSTLHSMLDVVITPHNAQDLFARMQLQLARFAVIDEIARRKDGTRPK